MPTSEVERARAERTRQRLRLVDLSSIGLVFPVAMILGYLAGGIVGSWFGMKETGQMVGGFLGIVSGFYNVYKVVLRLNAEEAAREAAERKAAAPERE
jgi:uncharacterized membrane protein